jgi:hypothetical protein
LHVYWARDPAEWKGKQGSLRADRTASTANSPSPPQVPLTTAQQMADPPRTCYVAGSSHITCGLPKAKCREEHHLTFTVASWNFTLHRLTEGEDKGKLFCPHCERTISSGSHAARHYDSSSCSSGPPPKTELTVYCAGFAPRTLQDQTQHLLCRRRTQTPSGTPTYSLPPEMKVKTTTTRTGCARPLLRRRLSRRVAKQLKLGHINGMSATPLPSFK